MKELIYTTSLMIAIMTLTLLSLLAVMAYVDAKDQVLIERSKP